MAESASGGPATSTADGTPSAHRGTRSYGGRHRAPDPARRFNPWVLPLVVPTILTLMVVIGYPIVRAVIRSFEGNERIDPETGRFVSGGFAGFEHYLFWLTQRCVNSEGVVSTCGTGNISANFWPSVGITFFFAAVTVSIEVVLGMWMAIVMGRSFLGRSLLRAAVLIPWAIPTAVTAKLWAFMFSPDGIVNALLGRDIRWTDDPWAARSAVIIADVWKTTPFVALLILAGLQMIPNDVHEAARVDGANAWQRFTRITLPLVKPALMVAILFRTLDALRMFDLPVIMIGASSNAPTATVSQLVVENMRQNDYNSASALSTMVFLMIFAVAFVLVKFLGANAVETQQEQQKGSAR